MAGQQPPAPAAEDYTDMAVGEILRRTREYYGQSLPDVESILRIRATQLEAIEKGDIEKLPGRVYAIGFVRAYSEYLGLDGDKMVHLFKTQAAGSVPKPELHFPSSPNDSKAPSLNAVLFGLVGVILFIVGWSMFMAPNVRREPVPPVPPTLKQSKITEAPSIVPPAEDSELEQMVEDDRVVLNVIDDTWVEVKNEKGAAILRRVLNKGDKYTLPPEAVILTTGNAGGVRISVGGKELAPLGKKGDVVRNLSLKPEDLLKNAAE